jgi:hypothetical protein
MTKLYNFQARLPFVFDADLQFTRKVRKGVPMMEAWRSNHDSIEVCVGPMRAVISADKTPMVSALGILGWAAMVSLSVQSVVSLIA